MVSPFDHRTLGQRVLFGRATAVTGVRRALEELGCRRALVIGTDSAHELVGRLQSLDAIVGELGNVVQHVPVASVQAALERVAAVGPDALVAVGGGSAIGLAKAVARDTGLPIIAVPTTFSGSEATDVWGQTENGRKVTGTDPRALPAVIVYDPELVASLPPRLAVTSGLNAVAHAVDSFWAPRADPINRALGSEGLAALIPALRLLAGADGRHGSRGTDSSAESGVDAAGRVLYGGYLAAVAFASAGSGLHHKICHVLGGAYNLDHASMHAVVLPYVAAWNLSAAPDAASRISAALGGGSAGRGLFALPRELGAPTSLRELGLAETDLPEAARRVLDVVPASNPRATDLADLERLLTAAWAGDRFSPDPR
jgi:alcohol dehydrogenase class IV